MRRGPTKRAAPEAAALRTTRPPGLPRPTRGCEAPGASRPAGPRTVATAESAPAAGFSLCIGLRSLEAPPRLRALTPCAAARFPFRSIASPHRPASCPGLFASPDCLCARPRLSRLHIGRNKGLPTHPPEPAYPCCLPALGEFCEVTPHEEPRPSLRHNRHPRQRGRRQCSNEPRLGNGSPRGDESRRPGQCADATADRTSTPFQASEHRLAFSAAARRQCDNQKSTTSLFLMRGSL